MSDGLNGTEIGLLILAGVVVLSLVIAGVVVFVRCRQSSDASSSPSTKPRAPAAKSKSKKKKPAGSGILTVNPGASTLQGQFLEELEEAMGDALIDATKVVVRTPSIAQGSFGLVYKGEWNGDTVAVKTLKSEAASDVQTKEFAEEALTWKRVPPHECVAVFYGCCLSTPALLIWKFYPGGGLDTFLEKHGERTDYALLDADITLQILLDVARGLSHLHANRILHRDLAARNVLLDEGNRARLTDFGLSRRMRTLYGSYALSRSFVEVGPLRWLAPEQLAADNTSESPRSDVFMFAMMLYEMLLADGRSPWQIEMEDPSYGVSDDTNVCELVVGGARPTVYGVWREERAPFVSLMERCWLGEPRRRPSSSELSNALVDMETLTQFLKSKSEIRSGSKAKRSKK